MRAVAALAAALVLGVGAGAPVAWSQEDQVPPPPIDLPTVVPQTVPPGFAPLPDQPGRLGPLDAPAAAGVLDQSGRVTATMLLEAGFSRGYSKAWSKADSGEVVIAVLLEFSTQDEAEAFHRGFLHGREQTTTSFPIPSVPEASAFERGPATPDRSTPAQREVVLLRGRVLAIVVVAGFQSYPAVEPAVTMAESQRAALAAVPEVPRVRPGDARPALTLLATVLFVAVASWLARVLRTHPPVPLRRSGP